MHVNSDFRSVQVPLIKSTIGENSKIASRRPQPVGEAMQDCYWEQWREQKESAGPGKGSCCWFATQSSWKKRIGADG